MKLDEKRYFTAVTGSAYGQRPCGKSLNGKAQDLNCNLDYNLEINFYNDDTMLSARFFIVVVAAAMAASFSGHVRAAPLDAFGRVYDERNMMKPGTSVCRTKDKVDRCPVLLQGVKPLYPAGNLQSGQKGGAIVYYTVDADGKVTVTASEATGPYNFKKWFGNHARIAVGSWTFEPGQRNGAPAPVNCSVEFNFTFDD